MCTFDNLYELIQSDKLDCEYETGFINFNSINFFVDAIKFHFANYLNLFRVIIYTFMAKNKIICYKNLSFLFFQNIKNVKKLKISRKHVI